MLVWHNAYDPLTDKELALAAPAKIRQQVERFDCNLRADKHMIHEDTIQVATGIVATER